ncbi:uncharacterized protein LOC135384713 [Ornithodoros turicata]|uniref:uncharacterized protein LOC135384713 n=1 Tax=Ornithodoros turicata TaxID=34597 RepID=UPI0031394FF8
MPMCCYKLNRIKGYAYAFQTSFKSNNLCILILPCPQAMYAIVCDCYDVIHALLMLSGDVQSNPGPTTEELFATLLSNQASDSQVLLSIRQSQNETEKSLTELSRKVNQIESEVRNLQTLKATVSEASDKLISLECKVASLTSKVEDVEARSRRNNLLIFGLEETTGESQNDLFAIVKEKIFRDHLNVTPTSIERVHRLGSRQQGKTRPVILKLFNYTEKIEILKNCWRLKGSPLSISEDLPLRVRQARKNLMASASDEKSRGCKVRLVYDKLFINDVIYIWNHNTQQREQVNGSSSAPDAAHHQRTLPLSNAPNNKLHDPLSTVRVTRSQSCLTSVSNT